MEEIVEWSLSLHLSRPPRKIVTAGCIIAALTLGFLFLMPIPHSQDFSFSITGRDPGTSGTCYTTTTEIFHPGATVTFVWQSTNGNETSLGVDNTYGSPIYGSQYSVGGLEQFKAVMGGYTFSTGSCGTVTVSGSETWQNPLLCPTAYCPW
jgi:hypothetical protein